MLWCASIEIVSHNEELILLSSSNVAWLPGNLWDVLKQGWVITKLPKKSKVMRSNAMVAVDCEMALCEDGTEALVKVCAVDRNLQVLINSACVCSLHTIVIPIVPPLFSLGKRILFTLASLFDSF